MQLFKSSLLTIGLLGSTAAVAVNVKVDQSAGPVSVKQAILQPSDNGRSFDLIVDVEYSNRCHLAQPGELMVIEALGEARSYRLTLAQHMTGRVCTMEYAPITKLYKISDLVDPADGVPSVEINGVTAEQGTMTGEFDELDARSFAHEVQLDWVRAQFKTVDRQTDVTVHAQSTYGNSCLIPDSKQFYRLSFFSFDEATGNTNLELRLVAKAGEPRACPAVYSPEEVVFNVLSDFRIQGLPSVTVNGLTAE